MDNDFKNLYGTRFFLYCFSLFNDFIFRPQGVLNPCCDALIKSTKVKSDNMYHVINNHLLVKTRLNILNYDGSYLWKCPLNTTYYRPCLSSALFQNYYKYKVNFDIFKKNKNAVVDINKVTHITADFSNYCNLRCYGCSHNANIPLPRHNQYTHMSVTMLKNIVSQFPSLVYINITNHGESLINPDFCKLIDICTKYKLCIRADQGFNLNHITNEQIISIINSYFDNMYISIDGASQEVYSIYKVGGNFDKVIENIKRINYFKNLYNNTRLNLIWRYILFDFNLHEVDKASEIARDLGVKFIVKENTEKRFKFYDGTMYEEKEYKKINEIMSRYHF